MKNTPRRALSRPVEEIFRPERIRVIQEENPFAKLSDIVYDIVAEAILKVWLEPGSALNIAAISDAFGISRTPVLRAVERLTEVGFAVENKRLDSNYRSYCVFDISEEFITDLYLARRALEAAAAEICARKCSMIDMDNLQHLAQKSYELWQEYAESNGGEFPYDLQMLDREFHEEMIYLADNKYLTDMYRAIRDDLNYLSIRTCEFITAARDKGSLRIMSKHHISICQAIASGIADMARMSVENHIDFCHRCCLYDR